MEPLWTITLFAELTLTRDGAVTRRFRSRKVASLLAYLAFYLGRSCSREFLCELLWPDEDPLVTRNRLRVTLASLRRQLEPPGVPFGAVLENVGNGEVRLSAERVATDVATFELAVKHRDRSRAMALYRGSLLPTLYDEWILAEQERFSIAYERLADLPSVPEETFSVVGEEKIVVVPALERTPPLPLYLTRFVGREAERSHIRELLADPEIRLITILGSGGNGKTRLAAEATRTFSNLAAFVPLADLWDPRRLFAAICQSLRLPPAPDIDPLERIAAFCVQRPHPLIVLDNLEQIALGAAPLISEMLARVPNLKLLVTSRRRLELGGEQEVTLSPLPLPEGASVEQLSHAASVRLFLDRSQSVRSDIQLTAKNAASIAAICRLLDGVPLALELAAARAGSLTPEQIRQRLEQNRGDLAGCPADKEDRHRSLHAVIEWSYALLPPDLRRFFLALSVFRGGWNLEAAESVVGEPQALDFLSRLRGHSLLTSDGSRFRLLETLRAWAEERQRESERAHFTARHSEYFLTFAERCLEDFGGPEESECLDRLQAEESNLRLAFENAVSTEKTETALRFALVFNALGRARGSLTDTTFLLDRALGLSAEELPLLRARILHAAGTLALLMHGTTAAGALLEQALPLSRRTGDSLLTSKIIRSLADNALFGGYYEKAQSLYEQALALQRASKDERGAMQTLNSLALLIIRCKGDMETASAYMRENTGYFRRIGDRRMLSYGVYNLGELALERGNFFEAEKLLNESLELSEEIEDSWQRLYCLLRLSRCAGRRGDSSGSRLLCREAAVLALQLGDSASLAEALLEYARIATADEDYALTVRCLAAAESFCPKNSLSEETTRTPFDDAIATARQRLPERSFQAAWRKGAALTPARAVDMLCESGV